MNENDSPNPTDIGGETLAPENVNSENVNPEHVNALVHVGSKPEFTADAKTERTAEAVAPDPFAVGVRVLRMAPAWLLSVTAGCSLIIILLGWMNPGGMANTVAYAPALNDARPAQAAPAAQPAAPAQPAEMIVPAAVPGNAASAPASTPAPESAPAPAVEQVAPAPEAPAKEQTPAPATPQAEVKAQPEAPAKSADAAGNLTVQVGSFNSSSEANARVSALRNAGFEARAVAVELPGRGTWYRVHVGRFADRDEASKAASGLRSKGVAAAIVVPVQK